MSTPVTPPPPRSPAAGLLDVVAVLVLVGTALLGLASTFAGWGYLVIGMVSAVLGVVLVLVTLRLPVIVPLVAIPIMCLLLGGPVALRDSGLGPGIPGFGSLAEVMRGSVAGWGELLGTLPFVDADGPPALVPYLLGFLGASVSSVLALRTRSAAAPVLPLLGVLVVVLLLRRPLEDLAWFATAFALVALGWTVARGLLLAGERAIRSSAGRAGRLGPGLVAALVAVLAVALAASLTSGSSAATGATLRGDAEELLELEGLDSPLARFRTFAEHPDEPSDNVHRKLLFTVTGAPRGSRVRIVALDRYDGREWRAGTGTIADTHDDAFRRMDTTVDNRTQGRDLRVQVAVGQAWRSAWLPTVGSLTSLRFLFEEAESRREGLRYNLATSTAVVPVGVGKGDDYEFTAVLPPQRLTPRMRPWIGPVMPVEGIEQVDPLIEPVLASRAPPMRKVFVLAKFLREEGRYSDGAKPGEARFTAGHDLERVVDDFLLTKRPVGNDEQYAAAMAMLANRIGVPARVVVGAAVPRDGKVRGEDVHVWVELRVSDGSWRVLPTEEFMGDEPPRRNLSVAPRPRVPPAAVVEPREPVTPPEVQREQQAKDVADAEQRSLVLRVLPWTLLVLLVLVVPLAKLLRREVRRRRGRPSDRVAGAWTELVDHARDLGIPVPSGATRPAQARVLALAGDFPHRADHDVFAQAEPEEAEVARAWADLGRERRTLGAGRPTIRRLWAPFSPASLVRSFRDRRD
ncbi:MAG TPA: transglutaminase domain-containing protein [Marmoricola sp.]|nr:transglutaminase domain-containing protein [Marmoricola sp.]